MSGFNGIRPTKMRMGSEVLSGGVCPAPTVLFKTYDLKKSGGIKPPLRQNIGC